jgi:hypothetical protein
MLGWVISYKNFRKYLCGGFRGTVKVSFLEKKRKIRRFAAGHGEKSTRD